MKMIDSYFSMDSGDVSDRIIILNIIEIGNGGVFYCGSLYETYKDESEDVTGFYIVRGRN